MTILPLEEKHIEKICALNERCFNDGWNENQLRSAFSGGIFYALGAFDGDDLIAAITFSVSFESADLEGIVTADEYKRQGVATLMLSKAEIALKEKGVNKILLEVRRGNVVAQAFYEKSGFKVISTRKSYYDDGEDALVMLKELL